MANSGEKITLTMAQFDDTLKQWKRKGAERALAFVILASLPLAVAGAFVSGVSPGQMIVACATYYCAVVGFAIFTQ